MFHKHLLVAFDRTKKDINNNNWIFVRALLVLSVDFRQTLTVIPHATYADEFNACLKQSYLMRIVNTLCLKTNMRIQLQNSYQTHTVYNSPVIRNDY